jgi:hypothetical protein
LRHLENLSSDDIRLLLRTVEKAKRESPSPKEKKYNEPPEISDMIHKNSGVGFIRI